MDPKYWQTKFFSSLSIFFLDKFIASAIWSNFLVANAFVSANRCKNTNFFDVYFFLVLSHLLIQLALTDVVVFSEGRIRGQFVRSLSKLNKQKVTGIFSISFFSPSSSLMKLINRSSYEFIKRFSRYRPIYTSPRVK